MVLVGCASPGPPRAPSLQLPQPVRDLSAAREGDHVTLRFTLPQRTTDNLPIREASVTASLCREEGEGEPCVAVPSLRNVRLNVSPGASAAERTVTWQDRLPETDVTGKPRLLVYRVQLSNLEDRTAGWSEPAYAVAGAAPAQVQGLRAGETRAGILLQWQPDGGSTAEVLLRREMVSPPKNARREETEPVWLESHASSAGETIDSTVSEETPYRYVAVRRLNVTLGQQKVKLDSAASAPVEITWRNAFPPVAPSGLSAAPFAEGGAFAVDLVWEPVEEPGLKGYLVTRQALDAGGSVIGAPERLTAQPVGLPAFHDATAKQGVRYRYSVQAVSKKGVEGAAATVMVEP